MIDPPQRSMLFWPKTGKHLISELYGSGSSRGYWLHTYAHAHWNRCTAITEPILQGAFSVISAWNGSGSPVCYQGRIIWTFQNRWEIEKIPFRSRDIGCWLKKTYLSISQNFKRPISRKRLNLFFWNLAYFLEPYWNSILQNFRPKFKSVHEMQKPRTLCICPGLPVQQHSRSPITQAELY